MAKAIGSNRGPDSIKRRAPGQQRASTGPTEAERDLLAAILDAADQDPGQQLPAVAASLARCAGCRYAGIVLLDGDGASCAVSRAAGGAGYQRLPWGLFPGPEGRLCRAVMQGSAGAFIRNSRPPVSPATETPAGPTGVCPGIAFLESAALVPVKRLEATVGFMFVGDERPGRISPRAAAFMLRAGGYLGRSLRSLVPATGAADASRGFDEMELVTRLIENASDSIVISQDWRILYVNQKCADSFGLSREEMVGTTILRGAHPDDRASLMERYSRIINGERMPSGTVARGVDAEGRTRWLGVREMPFNWNGRPAIMHMVNDITDRIRAEEDLRRSEERYRRLVETANEAIAVVRDGAVTFVSPRIEQMTGYEVSELQGRPFSDFIHPDDLSMVAERYARGVSGKETSQAFEMRFMDKAGNVIWAHVNAVAHDWEGRPSVLALISDITEWKMANEALTASEERYRLLADNAVDVIFAADLYGRPNYVSPSVTHLLGYTVEEALQRPLAETLAPASMEWAARGTAHRLQSDRSGEQEASRSWTTEIEMVRQDGGHIWTEVTMTFTRRPDGRPVGIMGVVRDVSDRRRAEQALKASEERFRTLLENSRDAVAVVDEGLRIVYGSPSLSAVTGHSAEEWTGMRLADVQVHPDDLPSVLSGIEALMRQPGKSAQDVAVRYRHGDGSWHVLEASARNLLHDPRVEGLVFNFRDITTRRRMEQELEESERRYRLLAENASDVIFTSDLNMKPAYLSPSTRLLTGFSTQESCALDLDSWLTPASAGTALPAYRRLLSMARDGVELSPSQRTATVELVRRGGGTVWAEVRIDFLRDAAGEITGLVGVARDITDRRAAEMERERRLQLEVLISEISTAFISLPTESMDAGIRNALAAIAWFTGADHSYIFTFSPDGSTASLEHECCSEAVQPAKDRQGRLPTGSIPWLMGQISQGHTVQVARMADFPPEAHGEKALMEALAIKSAMAVPMVQDGSVTGALGLGCAEEGREWDSETVTALRLVAEMFSNALERRRMDRALRESERRYRLLAENITDVIWTTDMGPAITYMSPSAARLVGYTQEELGRLTVADLLTPESLEKGLALHADLTDRQAPGGGQGGEPLDHWIVEVELRRKDGSTFCAEEQVSFMRDEKGTLIGLLGVTRDISQRKLMQDALRLSEQKYRNLVEASPDGVLSVDGEGIIIDGNPGLCRLLGYERDALRGLEVRQFMVPRDLAAEPEYHARLSSGEVLELETEVIRRDGQALPVWLKMVMLPDSGATGIQTIVYFRDIADRRKIDEMKDEFIGLVSHELRSPLTVIIGALNTAMSEAPRLSPKETNQLLQDAALEAEQLSHLVSNLLELSRAQANRLVLHVEPVNLSKTVHKVVRSIERQSPRHRFLVDLPARLPPVPADQLRLERVLHNLLENSVKYSPKDTEIRVSARKEAGRLVVSIADQGPGISREDQARLFKPFQQLGNPMLDHTKGAGLGLLVCRRLVEAHGGRIWVESEPGQGATFSFTVEAGPSERPQGWRTGITPRS